MRVLFLTLFLAASPGQAGARPALSVNGRMIELRCEDWVRGSDGSWAQTGVIAQHGVVISGMTLQDTDETRVLDRICPGPMPDGMRL